MAVTIFAMNAFAIYALGRRPEKLKVCCGLLLEIPK